MNVAQLVEVSLLRERIPELTEANDALERERDAMQARAKRAERRAAGLRSKLEQAWIRDAGYQAVIDATDSAVSIASEHWPFVRAMLAQYGQDVAALAAAPEARDGE